MKLNKGIGFISRPNGFLAAVRETIEDMAHEVGGLFAPTEYETPTGDWAVEPLGAESEQRMSRAFGMRQESKARAAKTKTSSGMDI
jgi:hypothetical protein